MPGTAVSGGPRNPKKLDNTDEDIEEIQDIANESEENVDDIEVQDIDYCIDLSKEVLRY